ncbi:DUF418 domain-containing protein [Bacillus sp. JCM 19041]|uniref:DUF418 domain-containing protein n=1 Tax=Bacillus sp. JCM 19041 TaxID=1460637 RepID=UPI0018D0C277
MEEWHLQIISLNQYVFTFFFYGYGLGFFSELGIFYGALLSLAFFTAQIIASVIWLRWFKMGPLEWLWRAGTYLRLPKMKRED